MMKFYKGASRILAGQKKMSTILIAWRGTMGSPFTGNKLTGCEWARSGAGRGIQRGGVVEKLRMGVDNSAEAGSSFPFRTSWATAEPREMRGLPRQYCLGLDME